MKLIHWKSRSNDGEKEDLWNMVKVQESRFTRN